MNEHLDPTNEHLSPEEQDIDRALRPLSFDDFAGQEGILENLKIFVAAANQREEALRSYLVSRSSWIRKDHTCSYISERAQCGD